MKSIKKALAVTGITSFAAMLFNALGVGTAFAQGVISQDQDSPSFITKLSGGATGIRGIVLVILDFFLGFLGLLAVIMVIYGGFLYVSSAGNEDNVNKAKKILMYAAIGIILIIVSFALVNTIFGAATGQPA
ncbi:hypothetical protein KBD59_02705 [Candidatus Gracilibacteria bacterium]|nr:hypothetical protein [Candidatus Gracilibacteria bacterium]